MTVPNKENAIAAPVCEPVRAGPAPSELLGVGSPGQGIRLVLVDDDDDYREAISGELTDLGFDVTDFSDGAGMFDHFASGGRGDVILLDWRMPGGSGIDLLGQARRRGINVPVVFLTGMLAASYETAALEQGALDFVNKSRGATILAKRVQLIVRAGKLPTEQRLDDTIVCGDLTLRPQISRALWQGVDVNLTVVEFNIVHMLVRRAGEYTTYRAIYDCVHHAGFIAGAGDDGYRTNVRSSIKRIRNKFRAIDADFVEIENFLAFGYRWRTIPTEEA